MCGCGMVAVGGGRGDNVVKRVEGEEEEEEEEEEGKGRGGGVVEGSYGTTWGGGAVESEGGGVWELGGVCGRDQRASEPSLFAS